jgi:hypothetical protein
VGSTATTERKWRWYSTPVVPGVLFLLMTAEADETFSPGILALAVVAICRTALQSQAKTAWHRSDRGGDCHGEPAEVASSKNTSMFCTSMHLEASPTAVLPPKLTAAARRIPTASAQLGEGHHHDYPFLSRWCSTRRFSHSVRRRCSTFPYPGGVVRAWYNRRQLFFLSQVFVRNIWSRCVVQF